MIGGGGRSPECCAPVYRHTDVLLCSFLTCDYDHTLCASIQTLHCVPLRLVTTMTHCVSVYRRFVALLYDL